MNNLSLTILFLITGLQVSAQIKVGEWQVHAPFNKSVAVTNYNNIIYCASESGIFEYNTETGEMSTITKTNALSDNDISSIAYNNARNCLFVGYSNGNLDIIQQSGTVNFSDIKYSRINELKQINHIFFNNNDAYLATSFGIVKFNIEKKEISETYFIGAGGKPINVNTIKIYNNMFFAATNEGVFTCNLSATNPIDFRNWNNITYSDYNLSEFVGIEEIDGILYTVKKGISSFSDQIIGIENLVLKTLLGNFDDVHSILAYYNSLIIAENNNLSQIQNILSPVKENLLNADVKVKPGKLLVLNNTIWFADADNGLIKVNANKTASAFFPNSPVSGKVFRINSGNNSVIVSGGGLNASWNNLWNIAQYYTFSNRQWNNIFEWNMVDFMEVIPVPGTTDQLAAASWGDGVAIYKNDMLTAHYTEDNSSLQSAIIGDRFVRVGGLAYDSKQNLWVSNSGVNSILSVKTATGNWLGINTAVYFPQNPTVGKLIITKANQIWIILPRSGSIFIYDYAGTVDNIADDKAKVLKIIDSKGEQVSDVINDIAQDSEGNIWVGTEKGPVLYDYAESVFDNPDFRARRIALDSQDNDGLLHYLLNSESITAIAIDGGDRVWFGTEKSGAFLIANSGKKEINHFTQTNSPLISNYITSIGINHTNGEVFFGTDKGIVSYRSEATSTFEFFDNVYVYPNPVRPKYTGNITIAGLVKNTMIKITDISGNLIYEAKATGGQAVWDGIDIHGNKIGSGIYLVFLSNDTGEMKKVSKFMVIR